MSASYHASVQLFHGPSLSDKVAFLRQADAYPDAPDSVTAIETHFAWVFLSRDFAYKLKKPVRLPGTDLRTVTARKANCELELALNRRLAGATYIGVVPLGREGSALCLELDSRPVDWLVKMRRLPQEATLENRLAGIEPEDSRLPGLVETLCEFYSRTVRAPWRGDEYATRLKRQSKRTAKGFRHAGLESKRSGIRQIAERQRQFVDRNFDLLADRVRCGRVRDVHGDLRPEHIFLNDHPEIIDCLEFSSDLRLLDTAEEIGFLALECERLGRADIGRRLTGLYRDMCTDDIPDELLDFYKSRRAFVRAYVSAWHLADDLNNEARRKWLDQTLWYLDVAEHSVERAFAGRNAD